jgi:AraC-like DNA-binding protein
MLGFRVTDIWGCNSDLNVPKVQSYGMMTTMQRSMSQEFFPEKITITHKITDHSEKVSPHIHENFEVLLINCDNIIGTIGKKKYNLKKKSLVLLNKVDLHWFRMKNSGTYDRYVITFMPENLSALSTDTTNLLDCFFYRPFPDPQILELQDSQANELIALFEELIFQTDPKNKNQYGNDLAIIIHFAEVLLTINRYYRQKHNFLSAGTEDIGHKVIYEIISYIHSNCCDEITLDTLAEDFSINKYSLSKIFRSVTGLPPIQYLIRCRLEKAKQYLHTEKSISEVCMRVGFNNMAHFSKAFKKYYGVSPKNYQMHYRDECCPK